MVAGQITHHRGAAGTVPPSPSDTTAPFLPQVFRACALTSAEALLIVANGQWEGRDGRVCSSRNNALGSTIST